MWLADQWNDYEVIDCSKGEKLERWGDYLLVRPDPQVIWDTPKKEKGWRKMNGHYHRSSKGGGEWEFFQLPKEWTIQYSLPINKKLTFHLKPFSFKHTGLFPEQAANWNWFSQLIADAVSKGRQVKVLNLFAYTGWGNTCGRCGRCKRNPCRCIQRHGHLGKRKCNFFRSERCPDPVAGR